MKKEIKADVCNLGNEAKSGVPRLRPRVVKMGEPSVVCRGEALRKVIVNVAPVHSN